MVEKKAIKKQEFSFEDTKKKYSSSASFKPEKFFDLGEPFLKSTGLPGPAIGHTNVLLGHSDTGKTTALIKTAVSAQQKGILPVFIITEQKWNFEHAKILGLDATYNDKTGDWEGFFFYKIGFQYIEQIFEYMNEILDGQAKGDIPYDIVFCWDSIGSIPAKLSFEGKGGNQHTARVISEKYGMGLHQRITGSRNVTEKYTNTVVVVNQPWVEIDMQNPMSQPTIKAKGGNAMYLASTLVFLFGQQKKAGISRIPATKNGRKLIFATRSKISILKNHVNGIAFSDGKIIVTPHGFILDTPEDIKQYKEEHSGYWNKIFSTGEDDVSDGSDIDVTSDDDGEVFELSDD